MMITRKTIAFLVFFSFVAGGSSIFGKKIVLKYGTIAPKGTAWARYLNKFRQEVERKSNKEIKIKIYFGGVAGDERTMVRKLKSGNLDIGSFTGIGLGLIVPESRVIEIPTLVRTYKQIDNVVKALYPEWQKKFRKKGFEVIGWSETGFIYLMSKKSGKKISDLRGQKVWLPSGDKLTKAIIKELGLVPVPLGIESVLTQLQLGGLDAVYAPPSAAIGLQWYRHVKYLLDYPLALSTAATVMRKKSFEKLPPEYRKLVQETSEKYNKALVKVIRRDNARGFKILLKKGLKKITIPKSEIAKFETASRKVRDKLTGKLWSKKILKKALKAAR